ncbi:thioredoxin domain-containing protein, partial [Streptomyces microflavus]|uniref:thioredoxin domain-containing protein n=1 Tax=Streptomyces microflavus TaxID=1919 RepID=UPI003D9E4C29
MSSFTEITGDDSLEGQIRARPRSSSWMRPRETVAWAMKMSKTFDKSGVQGTPTLKMDGKKVT